MDQTFLRGRADVRVDDSDATTDCMDLFEQPERISSLEVVEDPEAKHDIERAIAFDIEISNVVEDELEAFETEGVFGEHRLLDVGFAALDPDDLRAAERKLHGVQAFEAGKIKYPKAFQAAR